MAAPKTILISRAQAESARLLVETANKWDQPLPAGVRAMARALERKPPAEPHTDMS